MSVQIGFARANVLPREVAAPASGQRVLCVEVSPRSMNHADMQALFKTVADLQSGEVDCALLRRAHRQLQLIGRLVTLPDAESATVADVERKLLFADAAFHGHAAPEDSAAVELMTLRRPLEARVAAAAVDLSDAAAAKVRASADNADLVVLPKGLPVSVLLAQSEDAASPLQFATVQAEAGSEKKDLLLFYTHKDTIMGMDASALCACACCAALCACCTAILCCCCGACRGGSDNRAPPPQNAPNPYDGNRY